MASEGQSEDLSSSLQDSKTDAFLDSAGASQLLPPDTYDRRHLPGDTVPSAHGVFLVIHEALVVS